MIDAFLVAGLSGALISLYVAGLIKWALVRKEHDNGKTWKEGVKVILGKNIFSWVLAIYALLITLMIIVGLTISIVMGS